MEKIINEIKNNKKPILLIAAGLIAINISYNSVNNITRVSSYAGGPPPGLKFTKPAVAAPDYAINFDFGGFVIKDKPAKENKLILGGV